MYLTPEQEIQYRKSRGIYPQIPEPHMELPKVSEGLDASVIPADRMKEMQARYQMLKSKYPKMKDQRIVKKVAEYFKVKLVGRP